MIVATSQVANTVANLKSRYYKYLETLCNANGIDIGNLKSSGSEHEELEMFFGGLPVLIGLKYFDHLRVLRLFGQDILNLKPLVEVSATLEELWICEGPLKDLTGIDTCKKLQKLYIYDCQVEDASLLGKLVLIETLWIQNNNLKDLTFLDPLQQLTVLKIGGKQLNDSTALSVQLWPHRLQELDISGNGLTTLQSLLPLSSCELIRCFNVTGDQWNPHILSAETHFAWVAFHFPYLERLNEEHLTEKFQATYSGVAESALMEAYAMLLAAEKSHGQLVALIDKNYHQISERLNLLVATLSKVVLSVPRKEGRRELVMRIHEQTQHSLKALKKVKRQCLNYEYTLHRLHDYYFPTWRLEASKSSSWPRELDDHEIRLLEHGIKLFGTKNDEYEAKIKAAFVFNESSDDLERKQLKRHDVEKLFFIDLDRRSVAWDLRSCIGLCDRKAMANYREDAVRIFKDVAVFTNDAVEGTRFFILPMVKCDKHSRKFRFDSGKDETTEAAPLSDDFGTIPAAGEHIEVEADFISKGHIELAHWHELEFAVLLLIEIQFAGHVLFEDLRSPHTFEDRFTAQIKKLKSLGIDLKLEMKATTLKAPGEVADVDVPAANEETPAEGGKKAKVKKVEDLLNNASDLPRDRWRRQPPFSGSRRLSLRDPLELALTFSKPPIFVDNMDLCTTVTSLDLSGQKLTKLDGIDQLANVACLSLARNKLISLKKLKHLRNLTYLDASFNNISHFDEPPEMLVEINLANNNFVNVGFCSKLQMLTKLLLNHNKLKSLKGSEGCKLLEVLRAADNFLKEKTDMDIIAAFPKLTILDLSHNPLSETEDYKKKIFEKCPTLLMVDCEIIPKEGRQGVTRKTGKALTIDFISQAAPNFEIAKSLSLRANDFQMIALDRMAITKLQHLTEIDLSYNSIESLHDLVELENLQILNLAHNAIVTFTGTPVPMDLSGGDHAPGLGNGQNVTKILPSLKELDLSYNNLSHQTIVRMGLQLIPALKKLNLSGNQITKFDMSAFDFRSLIELDLSQNDIRKIKKKTLTQLISLNLADNKLKDLEGLSAPHLERLDLSQNKIVTCSSLKPLTTIHRLKWLNCQGNPVTERRVYADFVKAQFKSLECVDEEPIITRSATEQSLILPDQNSSGSQLSMRSPSVSESIGSGTSPTVPISSGLNIRIAEPMLNIRKDVKWQSSPSINKSSDSLGGSGTKRPPYCPPGSRIIVNERIAQRNAAFTFFPEGHYLSPDGTVSSTPMMTPHRRSLSYMDDDDGIKIRSRPKIAPKPANRQTLPKSNPKRQPLINSRVEIDRDFCLNGQRAIRHFRT